MCKIKVRLRHKHLSVVVHHLAQHMLLHGDCQALEALSLQKVMSHQMSTFVLVGTNADAVGHVVQ